MRVVFDGHSLLPPRSGIGHYTYQLVRALGRVEGANEYVIFYPRPVSALRAVAPPDFPEPNVHVAGQGWWPSMVSRVRRRVGLSVPVEQFVGAFDVFHAPNYLFTHPVSAARRVVTIHDMTLLLFPEWHPRERREEMGPQLATSARIADRILADSVSTKNDIVKLLTVSPERITVVPLAADPSFTPLACEEVEETLRRYQLEYGEYLLFVGTIEPRKNLMRLLEAVEIAGTRIGPLVVAGAPGWGNREIRGKLTRLEEAGRVRYLGYLADAERPRLMNGARAFVYPSLYEGFGLPVLEAMACGAPVVSSEVSSLPEVVGDAAILVDPYDVDALVAALERVWQDSALRAELRARGLAQAAGFSWEATARATLRVYRDVVYGCGEALAP